MRLMKPGACRELRGADPVVAVDVLGRHRPALALRVLRGVHDLARDRLRFVGDAGLLG